MKIQKKIIIWVFIICGLFINSLSFAQETNECKVCRTSSEEFDMILNMTNELSNYIKTVWKEGNYIWEYINPNRYEWTKFNPPSTKKRITNLVLKTESAITTTALIVSPRKFWWLEDYLFWFILMFKNKVFPRDYKKILDVEWRISDKIYELWLWWWYYSKINESNIKDIKQILDKYKDKWLLGSFYIDKDVRYKDIVNQCNKITSSLKNFLATKDTKQFLKLNWAITLNISLTKINGMKTAYECSNECNELNEKLGEEIKKINKSTKWSIKSSIEVINKSIKKFKNEIWNIKTENAFKGTLKINWQTWTAKNVKDIWETFKAKEKNLDIAQSINNKKAEIDEQISDNPIENKDIITNSILWIIKSHKEDLEYAIVTETKNSNYYFETLSKTINRDINIVKDFKKNLEEASNLQCSK